MSHKQLLHVVHAGRDVQIMGTDTDFTVIVDGNAIDTGLSLQGIFQHMENMLVDDSTTAKVLCPDCGRFISIDTSERFIAHKRLSDGQYCPTSLKSLANFR